MENKLSVIISTYNSPVWLEKVLWGYHAQTFKNFELIIADDGSKDETKELINTLTPQLCYKIKHVWHPDNGFQKSEILNKAVVATETDYILMSDGDCIPRADFLEIHMKYREKGRFLSGGYFKLPMKISNSITKEDILAQNCFDLKWLKENGFPSGRNKSKLRKNKLILRFLNTITTTKPTWNGHNASGWKEDLLAVNGLDERMQYGGQDRELGERLENYGIRGKQVRYYAICLHLDHPRGYATKESWERNFSIRRNTRKNKVKRTPFGISKDKTK